MASWIDDFFGPAVIKLASVLYPKRAILELLEGAGISIDVTDDPTTGATQVTITSSAAAPAGADGAMQFKDGSVMGGTSPDLTWDKTLKRLVLATTGFLQFEGGTAPASGFMRMPYAALARVILARKDSGGTDRTVWSFTANAHSFGASQYDLAINAAALSIAATGAASITATSTLTLSGVGGSVSLNPNVATGTFRAPHSIPVVVVRNSGGTADLVALDASGNDLFVGQNAANSQQFSVARIHGQAAVVLGVGAVAFLSVNTSFNVLSNTSLGSNSPTFGGGTLCTFIPNAGVNPSTNPSGGVIVYVDSVDGLFKTRRTTGEVVVLDGNNTEIMGLRLTVSTGVPVPTGDVANATTVYLTPFRSGAIALYDGQSWIRRTTAEISIALSGLTTNKNYDVFAYCSNAATGAVSLELSAAWTTDIGRADALSRQDGVLVKASATTRRYVGTFRATSATQTQDTLKQRFVWNMYNRLNRTLFVSDLTDTWTYASTTYRQANGSTANKVEIVIGQAEPVSAEVNIMAQLSGASSLGAAPNIGLDSTTVASGQFITTFSIVATQTQAVLAKAAFDAIVDIGYHAINWLEACTGANTITFWGDGGIGVTPAGCGSGMRVRFDA